VNRFYRLLTIILALCLPWHGAITVFLPDFTRYWKEVVLILFFAGFCWEYFNNKKNKKSLKDWMLTFAGTRQQEKFFAGLFLIYGLGLVLFSAEKGTALLAFRYLGLGFVVYLLFSLISQNSAKFRKEFFKNFVPTFIFSAISSTLFGAWIKFGNGAEITRNFYSQTISSWVPGQTIPLWHEAGDFIRLQGASSGPIEFSHILLVALFLTTISQINRVYKALIYAILCFGIYQSHSRAAIFAGFLVLLFHSTFLLKDFFKNRIGRNLSLQNFAKKLTGFFIILFIACMGFWGIKNTNILQRAGTSDHFTRPIEAMKFGLDNIFSNNLGKLGPAARAQNLRENNNDSAMIAENVFVDVFAQMGIIGVVLYLLFFWSLFQKLTLKFRGFFLAALIVMNLATIFDMTPVAILFFVVFFVGTEENHNFTEI